MKINHSITLDALAFEKIAEFLKTALVDGEPLVSLGDIDWKRAGFQCIF